MRSDWANARVGVLYGGNSAERAISLRSGQAILAALQSRGVNAKGIDVQVDATLSSQLEGIDVAFIALHGRGGEDGLLQAVLTVMGIPYTGSAVLASALGMDKLRTKQLWLGCGLPTPDFRVVDRAEGLADAFAALPGPVMVKPPHEGSSIGMTKVTKLDQLDAAYEAARIHDDVIMLEQWVTGEEYTCAILGDRALPIIRLVTPNDFYDFQAKYESNQTEYLCPCGLDEAAEQAMQALALRAFQAVGCRGWGRIDLMRDAEGQCHLLEVNTVPGMTDHSLVPMAAKAAGMSFADLVLGILALADY